MMILAKCLFFVCPMLCLVTENICLQMKEKRPVNTTPKKTLTNLKKCEDASPPMPDLRLEAKMSAEVRPCVMPCFIFILFPIFL